MIPLPEFHSRLVPRRPKENDQLNITYMAKEKISETLCKELKCQQQAARHPCKVQQYHVNVA